MSATILLDSHHAHYTNLDFLSGKVVLQLPTEAAIGGIQVKLEGVSRTRLSGPRHPHHVNSDKKRTELEVHKILYKVATVFPTPAVMQTGTPAPSYTFAAGSYSYPFSFKFPFNNSCNAINSMRTNLVTSGLKVEMARDTNRHVKKTLPPSLSGYPGMAEIQYFVKATVIRPQFYKENIRTIVPLNFLPIEPPRTGNPNEETYARRQHQFNSPPTLTKKKSGLFGRSTTTLRESTQELPRVSVESRLPNPSILTCNEPIPLRLIVKKVNNAPEVVFLQMLQIELISYTKVLAHDLTWQENGSWVVLSTSNMGQALSRPGDPAGTDWTIDPKIWAGLPLPSSVAPSFETCNIERSYELEVRVGLTHSTTGNTQPQMIVLPLRMPVKVYSGIKPPSALLEAMAAATPQSTSSKPAPVPFPSQSHEGERPPMPPRPPAGPVPASEGVLHEDAPPSYEDAMGENISPVDGPRREYHPPDASSSRSVAESATDSKSAVETASFREDGSAAEGSWASSRAHRSSSESFDMLPNTPPESNFGSRPTTPVTRSQSMMKGHRNDARQEGPPQYEPVAEVHLAPHAEIDRQPSRNSPRPKNLGVPARKPVPRNASMPH
ncbi:Uncharacterized protein PECH_007724 [Penicillium ucsense]|uniref:Arrestin-like N-terminal domain-containing protein n=1 Tax=Penicillium ucsense TaxID=2839758 RepID=A0A8J8WGM5_9EURO|nr:Uncharacterized protein PECM_007880 [Penicillium ucsense]KAF7734714.1 Uncharacterized protein PECH_007724 [Penicillium ucsense]